MRRLSLAVSFFAFAAPAFALEPADVFLLVNKNVPASKEVADHYCKMRKVPADHVITLDLPKGEDIGRKDYNAKMVEPLREALKDRKGKVTVLVSTYGVPLRVGREEPGDDEKAQIAKIEPELKTLRESERKAQEELKRLEAANKTEPTDELKTKIADQRKEIATLNGKIQPLEGQHRHLTWAESEACVDSELSLIWWEKYELRRFLPNPLHWQMPEKVKKAAGPMLLTARLDGPTPEIAKRLVDDAIEVEKKGLTGKVYVDARGIGYDPKQDPGYGYGGYDEALREMAKLLKDEAKMDVTLDDKAELFAVDSCPDCALYCGWYSLANYVDSFKYVRGSVAYHIASSEAVSLRNANSKLWCKSMLERGVAVTLGPVAEPYTIGFPKPAEFFGMLATGKYTVVECYHRTLLFTSWMTVLVGDPLYNPYAKTPLLKEEQVKPSPAKGQFFLREK